MMFSKCGHNTYWQAFDGACMACRAEQAEQEATDLKTRLAACEAECQEQCDGKIAFFNGMNDMREQREELQRKLAQAEARVQACEAELTKWRRIRTPTHGPCCTCQKCGQCYEECRCDLDEVADQLEQTKALVQALEQDQARLLQEIETLKMGYRGFP